MLFFNYLIYPTSEAKTLSKLLLGCGKQLFVWTLNELRLLVCDHEPDAA